MVLWHLRRVSVRVLWNRICIPLFLSHSVGGRSWDVAQTVPFASYHFGLNYACATNTATSTTYKNISRNAGDELDVNTSAMDEATIVAATAIKAHSRPCCYKRHEEYSRESQQLACASGCLAGASTVIAAQCISPSSTESTRVDSSKMVIKQIALRNSDAQLDCSSNKSTIKLGLLVPQACYTYIARWSPKPLHLHSPPGRRQDML